jgi:hypothetical protein
MTDDPEDQGKDGELSRWLQDAPRPDAPSRLDDRVAASYRRATARSWAARAWRARLSLPAPVAALLLIALFTAGVLARGIRWPGFPGPAPAASGLAGFKPLAEVQIRVAAKEGR